MTKINVNIDAQLEKDIKSFGNLNGESFDAIVAKLLAAAVKDKKYRMLRNERVYAQQKEDRARLKSLDELQKKLAERGIELE